MVARPSLVFFPLQHAPGHQHHQRAEQALEQRFGHLVSDKHPQRRKQRAEQGDQQGGAIAHQAMAQTVYRPHCRSRAHREQRHRRGLGHAQAQAQHQRGHAEDAAARAGQAHDQAHQHPQHTGQ